MTDPSFTDEEAFSIATLHALVEGVSVVVTLYSDGLHRVALKKPRSTKWTYAALERTRPTPTT